MSGVSSLKASGLEVYRGIQGFVYEEDRYTLSITDEARENLESDAFTPEIYGLGISAILAILAVFISSALGYTLLALLFIVPLVGVAIGGAYILYLKKNSKHEETGQS